MTEHWILSMVRVLTADSSTANSASSVAPQAMEEPDLEEGSGPAMEQFNNSESIVSARTEQEGLRRRQNKCGTEVKAENNTKPLKCE